MTPDPAETRLIVRMDLPNYRGLMHLIERVRRMFDLGADTLRIASHLSRDSRLRPLLSAYPGLRVPGVWDGFEVAVRAVFGQRLMATGSNSLAGQLVKTFGRPCETSVDGLTHLFPRPEELAGVDFSLVGITGGLALSLRALARSVLMKKLVFESSTTLRDTIARMRSTSGIGEAAAHYIAMRAFSDPDACEDSSREILQAAEDWRPWRAYASMYLWAENKSRLLPVTENR